MSRAVLYASAFLRLIRWQNLLIIAITQAVLHQYLYSAYLHSFSIEAVLNRNWFAVFMLTTLSLAAGANVINDYFDQETDRINRPGKHRNQIFSPGGILVIYAFLSGAGFLMALLIAHKMHRWQDIWIYPFSVFVLFYYSRKAKGIPILGNAIVAAFCGLVVFILLYAEQSTFGRLAMINPAAALQLYLAFCWFGVFAILGNWLREIVKDLEDMTGDASQGIHTFPVMFGTGPAKSYALLIGSLLLAACCTAPFFLSFYSRLAWWLLVPLPCLLILLKLLNANESASWRRVQRYLKYFMLTGFTALILLLR